MRQVTPEFAARLAAEVTTLALCWRIVRRDGVALGFTTHDRALWVAGLEYRSAPGMMPSAITLSDGFDVDTMEVAGALTGDGISDADLAAGRFDAARVEIFMVDWEAPEVGPMALARGTIGEVERRDAAFTAELRGPTHAFAASPVELLSPECRADLGDRRCRVDLARWTGTARVTGCAGSVVTLDIEPVAAGWFAYGCARFLDGPCAGTTVEIMESDGATVTLREALAAVPAAGDRVELRAGCDKRFASCRGRFGNALNFRGEPHVPGTDALLRYPGV